MTFKVRFYLADKEHVREFTTREFAEQFVAFCQQAFIHAEILA